MQVVPFAALQCHSRFVHIVNTDIILCELCEWEDADLGFQHV